ncbi:alpha/beta fold hydrolase [Rubrivivax sp. RP6-9]|uniref:alpha/beta fold hydrolase n=1 Tax=Rubrivivax sp. RP6-9 TaxID=3415750 RepID=UPI003CC67E4B
MHDTVPYRARHAALSEFHPLRGLRYHVQRWGDAACVDAGRPPLVVLHGWMDVGASFQFVVDALAEAEGRQRLVLAPDWRGFGRTEAPPTDTYWFPDYLADLDALLDRVAPDGVIDLVGHSMGGNVAMSYAGLRPARIRRLVNLEGFGLPDTHPRQAPRRLVQWLDELKTPATLRSYDSLAAVAERLRQNNPLLSADKAAWLAPHWAALQQDGRWHIQGDPAHKRVNPVLYRREEVLETWKAITAPVLWVEGDQTDIAKWWGQRYPRADFEARLAVVQQLQRHALSPCGHMLHHDQPQALAARLAAFLAT